MRTVSKCEIDSLRSKVIEEVKTNPELYHEFDVQRVQTDDWQLERFAQDTDNEEEAFKRIIETMVWKKSLKVHDMTDEDFPREFYEINGLKLLGFDKNNCLVAWNTSRHGRELSSIRTQFQQFLIHETEFLDRTSGMNGMVHVNDAKQASMFSFDLELNRFMSNIVQKHYPGLMRRSIMINLPMLLSPIFKLVLNVLNEKIRNLVVVASKSTLKDYLDKKFIPIECGGELEENISTRSPSKTSYIELHKESLTSVQIEQFKSIFSKFQ